MYDCENKWCEKCKWSNWAWSDPPVCFDCEAEHTTKMPSGYAPITNADRIRQMSDEELAVWFCTDRECDTQHCAFCKMDGCHIDEWLKSPVEEVQDG